MNKSKALLRHCIDRVVDVTVINHPLFKIKMDVWSRRDEYAAAKSLCGQYQIAPRFFSFA